MSLREPPTPPTSPSNLIAQTLQPASRPIGLCGGAGGLIVAALGVLGDTAGLTPVLYAIAALPLAVAALATLLPRPGAAPPGTVWSLRARAVGDV